MSHSVPFDCRQSHASHSLTDSARRLSLGLFEMSFRMNSRSAFVIVRPRYFSSASTYGTIAEKNVERKPFVPDCTGYAAGLILRHAGAPRVAPGSPPASST